MARTIIEEDLTIEGNIKSQDGNVDIKGRVIGDVTAQAVVVQGGGSVDGAVYATTVTLEGKHTGSLQCDDLKLASSSHVQADVVAKTMTVESGAHVVGKVHITGGS
ncbi:bactofilin family protein [Puniceibacterium confluentis]|uniref:bactofilin family protein n=1 Tax=Puniceibacterium confluentis TaxID=1958944 RepID=UPI0011B621B3|nr:polymer-forming cytoskeletal protein [Puniceibacterium confluentis]